MLAIANTQLCNNCTLFSMSLYESKKDKKDPLYVERGKDNCIRYRKIEYVHCTVSMIDWFRFFLAKLLSEDFSCIKLHNKGSRNIYIFFYLRKLSRLRGQFCSTALVKDTFMSNIALY